jgi:hypothetical protein
MTLSIRITVFKLPPFGTGDGIFVTSLCNAFSDLMQKKKQLQKRFALQREFLA